MIDPAILTSAALGLLQGLTEFLPISSSGHLVLAREVLGTVSEHDLAFDALLHFATATAIVVYFWRDIYTLLRSLPTLPRALHMRTLTTEHTLLLALLAGTVPAVCFGLLLEDILETVFRNPLLVAGSLIAGSCIMIAAEYAFQKRVKVEEHVRSWREGLIIGLFQSLALVPGMSRSGMAISGGMFFGITRDEAARFSFLLGAPLLLGAGAKKALELFSSGVLFDIGAVVLAGVLAAFLSALVVIHFLLTFLRTHTLTVFILYRLALALAVIGVVMFF